MTTHLNENLPICKYILRYLILEYVYYYNKCNFIITSQNLEPLMCFTSILYSLEL